MHNGTRTRVRVRRGLGEHTTVDDCVTGFGLSVCMYWRPRLVAWPCGIYISQLQTATSTSTSTSTAFFNHYYNFYYDFFAAFFRSPFARSIGIGYYLRFRHCLFIHLFVLPAKLARPHWRPFLLPCFHTIHCPIHYAFHLNLLHIAREVA